jgi:hypothetical protein
VTKQEVIALFESCKAVPGFEGNVADHAAIVAYVDRIFEESDKNKDGLLGILRKLLFLMYFCLITSLSLSLYLSLSLLSV